MTVTLCDDCGLELDDDQLSSCAADPFPWLGVRQHCPTCRRECTACREEALLEQRGEHGIRPMRRS